MKRKLYLAVLAALSATAIGSAYAAQAGENDALAIAQAKIGLTQAVTAAERHLGGKAARAEFEKHQGRWVFDVEVVNGGTVTDVKVDPANGRVIAAAADKADDDDGNDAAD